MFRRFASSRLSTQLFVILALAVSAPLVAAAAEKKTDAQSVEKRLTADVAYLASDQLEGRGVGTKGLDLAAGFIAEKFTEAGLKTDVISGSPFQQFEMTVNAKLGPKKENYLRFTAEGKEDQPLKLELEHGEGFNTLSLGGSGKFNAPVVFAGYGITAKENDYDDYADVDVKGKAVIIIRKEPQQSNPHSPFGGTKTTRHSLFSQKISNAYGRGAVAVILVNDHHDITRKAQAARKELNGSLEKLAKLRDELQQLGDDAPADKRNQLLRSIEKLAETVKRRSSDLVADDFDQLVAFSAAGGSGTRDEFPVVFARREAVNKVLQASIGKSLADLEAEIDKTLKSQSQVLPGVTVDGRTSVLREQAVAKNVIGVLEGVGPLADETVVIGAHYDHLGYGGRGSFEPHTRKIHNGADDNASGTAVLIEIARRLTALDDKPRRRIVFIAFTAEEMGLIGSARYIRDPVFALDKTVAMLNMDMVGRLRKNTLIVHGTGTAKSFDALIDEINQDHGLKITKNPSGWGPSDHSSFYAKKIPVLHFFTGTHRQYHRPTDDVELLNVDGMRIVADLITDVATRLATDEKSPEYKATSRPRRVARSGSRPYFGSIPDFSQAGKGYALQGVTKGGPADRAGIQGGDVIIKFGELKISNLEDFDAALRKYKAGDKVPVVVKRGDKELEVTVELDKPK